MAFLASTVATATQQRGQLWWKQVHLLAKRPGDLAFRVLTLLFVWIVILVVVGLAAVLLINSWPSVQTFGLSYLSNEAFDPIHDTYGVRPALFGTFVTSAFALLFAVPLGVGTALFLIEFCPRALRGPLAFLIDALAAIPSVVIGLWGFLAFAPWLQKSGEPWLEQHLGWLPFFQGTPHGLGLLAAGCILTVMILPIMTSISREVLSTVPREQREGLLALGATRWEVIRTVLLPYGRVGIAGAAILALGRALGETIAVTLVIGNQAAPPSANLFNTGYTLASVIANQFGEATPGLFIAAVLEAGLLLLVITLVTNILARLLIARMGGQSVRGGLV
jgi:phosphate transport system permease protein